MTPTLWGRWQTRFLLLSTAGLLITLVFGITISNLITPLALLLYVLSFGFGWDILYNHLQTYRWDHDWPPPFQVAAGVGEALFLWGAAHAIAIWQPFGWDNLPGVDLEQLSFILFALHYSLVWLAVFLLSQGPLRVIFPRWRFRGGQWL